MITLRKAWGAGLAVCAVLVGATFATPAAMADSGTPLHVSGVDTVGFPYVDLVLGGVPGLGVGTPPTVTATQSGTALVSTENWLLSAGEPLAVVVDAQASELSDAQSLAAEILQDLPPEVPVSLVPVAGTARAVPTDNRDAFMTRLSHLRASVPGDVNAGVRAAAAAGTQHVLVVTTCASQAPAAPPVGVRVDVLAVGSRCNAGWEAFGTAGAGTYTTSTNFVTGLATLDRMVAAWRSSVVLITSVLTAQPVVLSVGGHSVTTQLTGVPASAGATPAAPPVHPAPAAATDHTPLVVGLVLLVLALALVLWLAVRRGRHAGPARPATVVAPRASPAAVSPAPEGSATAALEELMATPPASAVSAAPAAVPATAHAHEPPRTTPRPPRPPVRASKRPSGAMPERAPAPVAKAAKVAPAAKTAQPSKEVQPSKAATPAKAVQPSKAATPAKAVQPAKVVKLTKATKGAKTTTPAAQNGQANGRANGRANGSVNGNPNGAHGTADGSDLPALIDLTTTLAPSEPAVAPTGSAEEARAHASEEQDMTPTAQHQPDEATNDPGADDTAVDAAADDTAADTAAPTEPAAVEESGVEPVAAEAPAAATPAEAEPIEAHASDVTAETGEPSEEPAAASSEFQWTKLEWRPVEWSPAVIEAAEAAPPAPDEAAKTDEPDVIDLREPAAVDLRDGAAEAHAAEDEAQPGARSADQETHAAGVRASAD